MMRPKRLLAILMGLLAACGDPSAATEADTDTGSPDVATDAESDVGSDAPTDASADTTPLDVPEIDPPDATAEDVAPDVTAPCDSDAGLSICGTACVDRQSDPAHCGTCQRACGAAERCERGNCESYCHIDDADHARGATNPANVCELCDPARAADTWSAQPDGTECGGGRLCHAGACGAGCFIDGAHHAPGAADPANACRACAPETATRAWTTLADGVACESGRVCAAGACEARCIIDGALWASDAVNPADPCEHCDPVASTTTWTGRDEGAACGDGQYCSAGLCTTVLPPRPIRPLSGSTVTSRRPRLRWGLAAGTDGARVELCRDRACTDLITGIDVAGDSFVPASDLPAGLVYWRLLGRNGALTGATHSATWVFRVGARSGPRDTVLRGSLDLNGDGFGDLAIGAPGVDSFKGRADVYYGTATGLPAEPSVVLESAVSTGFGYTLASAGDVNGDGYADLLVGGNGIGADGLAYVFHGGPTGIGVTPSQTLTMPDPAGPDTYGPQFGKAVAGLGDVNGDGYADIAVSSPSIYTTTGRVYLYYGSATGVRATPDVTLAGPDGTRVSFGHALAGVDDVNGDGFADLLVGGFLYSSNKGRAYLFLGRAAGPNAAPSVIFDAPAGAMQLGWSVEGAGDVNGDGFADMVIGAHATFAPSVHVYHGAAANIAKTPAFSVTGPDRGGLGYSVSRAGDVNGDGYGDIIVGAPYQAGGSAFVYRGSSAGLVTAPLWSGTGVGGGFGFAVTGGSDIDGDGFSDVSASDGGGPPTGAVWTYAGASGGPGASPLSTVRGTAGAGVFFGNWCTQ